MVSTRAKYRTKFGTIYLAVKIDLTDPKPWIVTIEEGSDQGMSFGTMDEALCFFIDRCRMVQARGLPGENG